MQRPDTKNGSTRPASVGRLGRSEYTKGHAEQRQREEGRGRKQWDSRHSSQALHWVRLQVVEWLCLLQASGALMLTSILSGDKDVLG